MSMDRDESDLSRENPSGQAANSISRAASAAEKMLRSRGIHLTLGGEPTYVPFDPAGEEWSVAALGPSKLGYALAFADAIAGSKLPGAFRIVTPGKLYPGELNPRWVVQLVRLNSGKNPFPLTDPAGAHQLPRVSLTKLLRSIGMRLGLNAARPLTAYDPVGRATIAAVLPLGHNGEHWTTAAWRRHLAKGLELLAAEGPAGLRLPLNKLPANTLKSALVLEIEERRLRVFVPPLRQDPFLRLLRELVAVFRQAGISHARLEGYLPSDEKNLWTRVGFAADPGVLEVNLPPCESWQTYRNWLAALDECAAKAGLRSSKLRRDGSLGGTGGGNHILLGGPGLDKNPFFTRPGWVAGICRYFHHHPSLAYLFTGEFCGPASQAPRPDESGMLIEELELAYSTLEQLPPGDHRALIADTLRNLHADASGSAHRSEISFDKFWCPAIPGGNAGLIEFRAIEAFPDYRWNAAAAALLLAIAARIANRPFQKPLREFGPALHDRHLLPSAIWADFRLVLADLARNGFDLHEGPWRAIWEYRFPRLLESDAGLVVRRAIEPWPLLSDIPLAGANTSRFVDSSLTRLEFSLPPGRTGKVEVLVGGRPLPLIERLGDRVIAGLRFRSSALHPSLHPAIPVQLPLFVEIRGPGISEHWVLRESSGAFERSDPESLKPPSEKRSRPIVPSRPGLVTADLRISS